MAARNPSPEGEFSPHKPRSPPLHKHSHQPGHKVSPHDSIPIFEAQTLTPGSAPADKTYLPQPTAVPATSIDPLDSVPGATSRDVYSGIGMPVQGMSSTQVHHDGQPGRKREQLGLAKYGAGGETQIVRERFDERLKEAERGKRGRTTEDNPSKVLG